MLFWTIVKVGLKSLVANPLRSFLAMLGIIIGVAAVISMLALGAGAKKQTMDRIQANGANLLTIWPGQPRVRRRHERPAAEPHRRRRPGDGGSRCPA